MLGGLTSFFLTQRLGFPETLLEMQCLSLDLLTVIQIEFVWQHQRKKRDMKNLGMEYEVYKSLLVQKVDCPKGLKRSQRFYSHMHSFANFPQEDLQGNDNAFNHHQGPSTKMDRQHSQNGIWIKSKSNS